MNVILYMILEHTNGYILEINVLLYEVPHIVTKCYG